MIIAKDSVAINLDNVLYFQENLDVDTIDFYFNCLDKYDNLEYRSFEFETEDLMKQAFKKIVAYSGNNLPLCCVDECCIGE